MSEETTAPDTTISDDPTEEEIRTLFCNRKKATLPFDHELPDVLAPLTGKLALRELSALDVTRAERLATDPKTGIMDEALNAGALVAMSLLRKKTGKRIFADKDFRTVAGFGLIVTRPIGDAVTAGLLSATAAKKTSQPTPEDDSASSSTENSEEGDQEQTDDSEA